MELNAEERDSISKRLDETEVAAAAGPTDIPQTTSALLFWFLDENGLLSGQKHPVLRPKPLYIETTYHSNDVNHFSSGPASIESETTTPARKSVMQVAGSDVDRVARLDLKIEEHR